MPLSAAPLLAGTTIGNAENDFVLAEWKDQGGVSDQPRLIAPYHVHHRDDEAWYVLEGVLHVRVADRVIEARAGGSVLAPKGTPHTYWNPSTGLTRYLLIMTPNIFRLITEIHATTERTPALMQALFRKYESELLA